MTLEQVEWSDGLTMKAFVCAIFKSALQKNNYDIKRTSLALGISRASVYKKVYDAYGVNMPELRVKIRQESVVTQS